MARYKQYSLTKKRFKKLIEYAITDPEEGASEQRIYKYPFTASEVLSIPDESILDLYFQQDLPNNEVQGKDESAKEETIIKNDVKLEGSENTAKSNIEKMVEEKNEGKEVKENIDPEVIEDKEVKVSGEEVTTDIEISLKESEVTKPEEEAKQSMDDNGEWNPKEEEAKFVSMLQSDISGEFSLTSTIIKDNPEKYDLVKYLFSFIAVESGFKFNELLAGYFKKVAITLITGKPRDMADFFEKHKKVIDNLFEHCTNQSISDVLCKVLALPEIVIDNPAWLEQTQIDALHKLLTRLEDPKSTNPSQLVLTFNDLVDQCKKFQRLCCSIQIVKRLILMSLNKSKEVSETAVNILTKLLRAEDSCMDVYLKEQLDIFSGKQSSESEELLTLINQQFEYFKTLLLEDYESILSQSGIEVHPLRIYRLKVVEYISCIIRLKLFFIIDKLDQLQYPSLLWDLFIRFPMNSILHATVFALFKFIFESECKSLILVVTFTLIH
jgi:hypothetical protein